MTSILRGHVFPTRSVCDEAPREDGAGRVTAGGASDKLGATEADRGRAGKSHAYRLTMVAMARGLVVYVGLGYNEFAGLFNGMWCAACHLHHHPVSMSDLLDVNTMLEYL